MLAGYSAARTTRQPLPPPAANRFDNCKVTTKSVHTSRSPRPAAKRDREGPWILGGAFARDRGVWWW